MHIKFMQIIFSFFFCGQHTRTQTLSLGPSGQETKRRKKRVKNVRKIVSEMTDLRQKSMEGK